MVKKFVIRPISQLRQNNHQEGTGDRESERTLENLESFLNLTKRRCLTISICTKKVRCRGLANMHANTAKEDSKERNSHEFLEQGRYKLFFAAPVMYNG